MADTIFSPEDLIKHVNLPQEIIVEKGHLGKTDNDTLAVGEVLTIYTLRKEDFALSHDRQGRAIRIPLNTPARFFILKEQETGPLPAVTHADYETLYTLPNILKQFQLPISIRAVNPNMMTAVEKSSAKALTVNKIVSEESLLAATQSYTVLAIPLTLPVEFKIANTGAITYEPIAVRSKPTNQLYESLAEYADPALIGRDTLIMKPTRTNEQKLESAKSKLKQALDAGAGGQVDPVVKFWEHEVNKLMNQSGAPPPIAPRTGPAYDVLASNGPPASAPHIPRRTSTGQPQKVLVEGGKDGTGVRKLSAFSPSPSTLESDPTLAEGYYSQLAPSVCKHIGGGARGPCQRPANTPSVFCDLHTCPKCGSEKIAAADFCKDCMEKRMHGARARAGTGGQVRSTSVTSPPEQRRMARSVSSDDGPVRKTSSGSGMASPVPRSASGEPHIPTPEEIGRMTIPEVLQLLKRMNLTRCIPLFQQNMINGSLFLKLSDEMLKEDLGVASALDRMRLLDLAKP
eukprot:m.73359 g.73359  ORF g.73359 m.73359 type:complete len:515 (+) comp12403_c0_seq2:212-1756(+)